MNFATDNVVGASGPILQALVDANAGTASTYGADVYSQRAHHLLCEVFERACEVFLVATGTAANALALGAMTPPHGAVFCHADAHVMDSECGAPEMFTGGAKLVGIHGAAGKLTPTRLEARLALFPAGVVHQVQPAAITLSQATESGTAYTAEEIAALAHVAHAACLQVHMDGARFANALVGLGCTAAEMTWKAGIDVLSFGASKNGALACEAVVFFDPAMAARFGYQRKRGGHTVAKGRFLGAQMVGYLEGGHWLDLARAANRSAARLADGLAAIPGVVLPWPTQANEVFVALPGAADRALKAAGALYYDWGRRQDDWRRRSYATSPSRSSAAAGESAPNDAQAPVQAPAWAEASAEAPADAVFVRLVCSYATPPQDIERFIAIAKSALPT